MIPNRNYKSVDENSWWDLENSSTAGRGRFPSAKVWLSFWQVANCDFDSKIMRYRNGAGSILENFGFQVKGRNDGAPTVTNYINTWSFRMNTWMGWTDTIAEPTGYINWCPSQWQLCGSTQERTERILRPDVTPTKTKLVVCPSRNLSNPSQLNVPLNLCPQ